MQLQEDGPFGGGVLANDCGSGKTLTTLNLIAESTDRQTRDDGDDAKYAPTLIICPAPSIDVWYKDWSTFFSDDITFYQFYGNKTSIKDKTRHPHLAPSTAEELVEFIKQMDPKDPKVSESSLSPRGRGLDEYIPGFDHA